MADSNDITQQADIKKLSAEAVAIIAKYRLKLAESEAKCEAMREAIEKILAKCNAFIANCRQKRAEREAETAEHADIEKLLDSAAAIITTQPNCDKAEWEAAIAEVERLHREARKLLANRQREANPFLSRAEWMCFSFLVTSLVAKTLF